MQGKYICYSIIYYPCMRLDAAWHFSLLVPNCDFNFTDYFQPIVDEFALAGRNVDIRKKDKKVFGTVEFAFLKDNTEFMTYLS